MILGFPLTPLPEPLALLIQAKACLTLEPKISDVGSQHMLLAPMDKFLLAFPPGMDREEMEIIDGFSRSGNLYDSWPDIII